ncbi:hypothetical protein SVAN01_07941 [Stagonosporopsis vannaccii]|nr:hypothetical protein SVAN01_07941 [Stagonosporopsis vannaccii]
MDGDARLDTGKEIAESCCRTAPSLLVGRVTIIDVEEAAGSGIEGAGGTVIEGAPETRKNGEGASVTSEANAPNVDGGFTLVNELTATNGEDGDE